MTVPVEFLGLLNEIKQLFPGRDYAVYFSLLRFLASPSLMSLKCGCSMWVRLVTRVCIVVVPGS